jgi:hypothetical protein
MAENDEVPRCPSAHLRSQAMCGSWASIGCCAAMRLDGQLADMTFTDPPCGVNYANSQKDKPRGKHDDLGSGFEAFLHDACTNHPLGHQGRGVRLHEQLGSAHPAAGRSPRPAASGARS